MRALHSPTRWGCSVLVIPELLVFSLDMHDRQGLLNTVRDDIRAGGDPIPGIEFSVGGWQRKVIAEEVPNPGDIVFTANRFYQRPDEFPVPVLQLTYSDENGIFPWDERFDDLGHSHVPAHSPA